jgi:hypothetical protein
LVETRVLTVEEWDPDNSFLPPLPTPKPIL